MTEEEVRTTAIGILGREINRKNRTNADKKAHMLNVIQIMIRKGMRSGLFDPFFGLDIERNAASIFI